MKPKSTEKHSEQYMMAAIEAHSRLVDRIIKNAYERENRIGIWKGMTF